MNKLLLVIDVQKDFINEITKPILFKIEQLVNSGTFENICFTKFINDTNSIFYRNLNYAGCLTKEQQKIALDTKNYKIFDKKIYSSFNDELKQYLIDNNIDEIYLCGFDTDACVFKTALDLFENSYNIYVLKNYCMSSKTIGLHDVYINNLARLIGENRVI